MLMSFDAAAASFDRHRALPDGAAAAIRTAVLSSIAGSSPCLLDLGAGTGRIGRAFVAAGDDYFGVDLSLGMLRRFAASSRSARAPRLVQSDGQLLPFRDAAFDAVLMIQVFGGLRGWRRVVEEARRVLRRSGALILGRTVAPAEGVDARMKAHLASILREMAAQGGEMNAREDVQDWLATRARSVERAVATAWDAERTPRGFVARHRTGARFSQLPEDIKDQALSRLESWAADAFGSLDAVFTEPHEFELQIFRFSHGEKRRHAGPDK
jgi:ubiquinone/menaquinone biosynthesis C-methylase UbiE